MVVLPWVRAVQSRAVAFVDQSCVSLLEWITQIAPLEPSVFWRVVGDSSIGGTAAAKTANVRVAVTHDPWKRASSILNRGEPERHTFNCGDPSARMTELQE